MELIVGFFLIISYLLSIIANIVFVFKIRKVQKTCEQVKSECHFFTIEMIEHFSQFHIQISNLSEDLQKFYTNLKENLDVPVPTKANNWDGMRKVFKSPIKIEVNERKVNE